MLSEVILLLVAAVFLLFIDQTGVLGIALQLFVALLCIPAIRLVVQGAPPFVPTSQKNVRKMMEFADIHPGEKVYDLGCGDGRLLLAAAEKGAIATGFELSVPTLLLAKVRTFGHKDISVRYGDIWKQDYRDADVLFCFLLLDKMKQFENEIWPTLKPGCRVVSHMFPMPTVVLSKREGKVMVYMKG